MKDRKRQEQKLEEIDQATDLETELEEVEGKWNIFYQTLENEFVCKNISIQLAQCHKMKCIK